MEALRKLDTNPARILRDGKVSEISSEQVTEGDILILEADESALTDESLASSKKHRTFAGRLIPGRPAQPAS